MEKKNDKKTLKQEKGKEEKELKKESACSAESGCPGQETSQKKGSAKA